MPNEYDGRMKNEGRTERIVVLMKGDEVAQLDEWMFTNRVRTRSEAIRQLIARGLDVKDEPAKKAKKD